MRPDLLAFPPAIAEQLRRQVREALAAQGVPPQHLAPIVDIAFHAADAAAARMMEVLGSLDGASYVAASGVAAGLIKGKGELLEHALLAYGEAKGLRTEKIRIGGKIDG